MVRSRYRRRSQGNDGGGDAENIIIQDYAKVTATAYDGAAIGSGSAQYSVWGDQEKSGVAKNIVIRGHAIVNAKNDGSGAAIGAAGDGKDASAEVTIGTEGATAATEDVRITAIGTTALPLAMAQKIPRSPFRAM